MGTIYVSNTSKLLAGTLHAHDGDSVEINPNAIDVPVDSKFAWKMPLHVTQKTAPIISTSQPIEHVSNLKEALHKVKEQREHKAKMAASVAPVQVGKPANLSSKQIVRAANKAPVKVSGASVGDLDASNPLQSRRTTARVSTGPARFH